MKMIKTQFTAACLLVTLILNCSASDGPLPNIAIKETLRTTSAGETIGFVSDKGAHTWLGIPFANSPEGKNRWRSPKTVKAWQGVYQALEFSEPCVQFSTDEKTKNQVIGSEDCLYLNIFAPTDAKNKALPVMLWVHGGGNVWGKASDYDGSNLAINENVIVVTVQYRLGPLGYFAHSALRNTAESYEDKAANFAHLDIIKSLQWLQKNIKTFGGNPNNITLFGESAGGHNTVALMGSPLAKGLFHRAIIQSGGFASISLQDAESSNSKAFNPSEIVLQKLQIREEADQDKVLALQAKSTQEIFNVYSNKQGSETDSSKRLKNEGQTYTNMPLVISDGITLPKSPLEEAFSSTDTFNAVPLIMGTNRDEMKLFFMGDPNLIEKKYWVFPVAKDQRTFDLTAEYASRLWRIHSVDEPALQMAKAGHKDVWAYRFDWDESGTIGPTDLSKLLGAAHAMEIPFVFNDFDSNPINTEAAFPKKNRASQIELGSIMGAYWASFARDGYPGKQPVYWPRYTENDKVTLIRFDSSNDAGVGPIYGADSLKKLTKDLITDSRMKTKERCKMLGLLDLGAMMSTNKPSEQEDSDTKDWRTNHCPQET